MIDKIPPVPSVAVSVQRGAPTDEELAAVIAVVGDAYTAEVAAAVADERSAPSVWHLSRRGLRAPLPRDLGWRNFVT